MCIQVKVMMENVTWLCSYIWLSCFVWLVLVTSGLYSCDHALSCYCSACHSNAGETLLKFPAHKMKGEVSHCVVIMILYFWQEFSIVLFSVFLSSLHQLIGLSALGRIKYFCGWSMLVISVNEVLQGESLWYQWQWLLSFFIRAGCCWCFIKTSHLITQMWHWWLVENRLKI